MANGNAMSCPPPHLEGNLCFHKPTKFGLPRSKRGFFVLLETVIHRYDKASNYYKGQRPTKEFEIRLDEVCGITEVLLTSKPYQNCSFSLTLNDSTEHVFSAESRKAMEQWVNGLRAAKEFWTQHHTRTKIKQKLEQKPAYLNEPLSVHNELSQLDDSISSSSSEDDKLIAEVHVTTWDGVMHKILLPPIFDAEELLSALNGKVQGTRCATCPICKLQQSSMEIWIVTDTGIGKKLDHKSDAVDVSKHGRHFYLLVHNYKLLIIHFEDGTFQVLPRLVSLKAKEVPYLPIFADKLSSLGFNNFGLFLVTDSGTSHPFDPEEEPLKYSFNGRLLLKNRVLTVSSPASPTSLDIKRQLVKRQRQNRQIIRAVEKAEQERWRQNNNFPVRNTNNTAFTSPHGLEFRDDHYGKPESSSCVEHTNIAQASTNAERICGSTERDSTEEEHSSTEINGLNAGDSEQRVVQENEQNLPNNPACVESSEYPNRPNENGSSSEQIKESTETLSNNNDTLEMRAEGETSSIDDKRKKSDVTTEVLTTSGMQTRVQPNLANNELENHKNNGIGTSRTLVANVGNSSFEGHRAATNQEIVALTNETSANETNINQCVATNDENTAQKNETDPDASIDGYLAAKNDHDKMSAQKNETDGDVLIESYPAVTCDEASLPGTTSNDSDPSSSSSHEEAPSHETSTVKPAGLQRNTEIYNICKERPYFEIHQCDFTIVGSPCVLELVLRVCSGHKVNEEEVGEANIFTKICLSGWHLRCENGTWSLVERGGRLPILSDSLSSTVKVQLTKNLEACFHKEEKLWTVEEHELVANESLVAKNPIANPTFNSALGMPENGSKFQGAGSNSGPDTVLSGNKLQGDATFDNKSSEITNAIRRHSLNRTLNLVEEVVKDREVASNTSTDTMPLSVNKSQRNVSENLDGARRNKPSEVLPNSGLPSPQEALHAAIQGIFHHMSKFNESPEEALDDSKHESIVESVCEPLCRALWNVLSAGLRRRMLLGKYTVWNVVENFKDVSSQVCQIVDWVNSKYACLEEPQKFQAFVCECLNVRQGTLNRWLESLISQKKKLDKYYGEDGLMFQLPRAKLEELVLDLKRISSLPFELHFEKWIKKHGYDLNRPAFTFA